MENQKYNELIKYIKSFGSVAVAFSSGVDSTFLLYAAHEALGEKCIAITASSGLFPKRELNESVAFCKSLGVKQIIFDPDELNTPGFCENPKDRCYICKKGLMGKIKQIANENGSLAVLEGSNVDDEGDYRPGLMAVKELGIESPLRHVRLTKGEIRQLSHELKLPTWDKPSFACLASRFPYGELITSQKLDMVDKAENLLLELGFKQFRGRIHGMMARIEVCPDDFPKLIQDDIRIKIYDYLKSLGFTYVSMDLGGYRTGSLNEVL